MKYDKTKCNNLNFKLASGLSGFMKVTPKGDCYFYLHDKIWDADAMMQKPRFGKVWNPPHSTALWRTANFR